MIDDKVRAVFERLEREDALERQRGASRKERLRQIGPEVGRFLHTLVLAARPHAILEIGTSGAYSTIWLATAARAVGATVTTLEIDRVKIARAKPSLHDAAVEDVVTLVNRDAFAHLRERTQPLDFVFLDAEKEDYLAFLDLIVPLLTTGGILVADNLVSHAEDLAEFRDRALSHPQLSAVVVPIGRGELLAAKIG
jgi:predicted O-methyltransferase YrrM